MHRGHPRLPMRFRIRRRGPEGSCAQFCERVQRTMKPLDIRAALSTMYARFRGAGLLVDYLPVAPALSPHDSEKATGYGYTPFPFHVRSHYSCRASGNRGLCALTVRPLETGVPKRFSGQRSGTRSRGAVQPPPLRPGRIRITLKMPEGYVCRAERDAKGKGCK